jgi:hypothetical protein
MGLGDIQSTLLSIVGEALLADSGGFSGTDLDNAINMCLKDLSQPENCPLDAEDADQSLAANGATLNHPTDYVGLIAITLTNASSVADAPLTKLKGGHKEYRRLMDNDSSLGQPEWFSSFNGKFYVWRNSNGAYTVRIEYLRTHPEEPANILYGEDARLAIYAGVCYYKAMLMKKTSAINVWGPEYAKEKGKLRASWPEQPSIAE